MLNTLFLTLCLSDSSFYFGLEIKNEVFKALFKINTPFIMYIIGPKEFPADLHQQYPLYFAAKIKDSELFNPYKHGNILISSQTTDLLKIAPFQYNPGKTPLPQKEESESSDSKLDTGSTSSTLYFEPRNLNRKMDLPKCDGVVNVCIVSGGYVSNVHTFTIKNSAGSGTDADVSAQLKKKAAAIRTEDSYYFTKTEFSPPVPQNSGITLTINGGKKCKAGKPFPVYGSFNLPINDDTDKEVPLLVHIVITGKTYQEALHNEVIIPGDMTEADNGCVKGYFMVDLMKEFFYKGGKRFDIPEEIYMTAVYKNIFTEPMKISLGK